MEDWMFMTFTSILDGFEYDAILIAGDLYDKRTVPEHVMLKVIHTLNSVSQEKPIVIMHGNHDEGGLAGVKDSTISSAEFTANFVQAAELVKSTPEVWNGMYLIPHMFNQEEFDRAVEDCPGDCFLVCHCNIDSPFAEGDTSLNLSTNQIRKLKERGVAVIAGHEHVTRSFENVFIPGNQLPTSVSDCQGCKEKVLYIVDTETGGIEENEVFFTDRLYKECNYKDILQGYNPESFLFIKISGECTTEEWPEVLRAYAAMRKKSDAFVISNKVQVAAYTVGDVSVEKVTKFNVVDLLIEAIDEEFREDVKDAIKVD
jgi:DNA repair exonuclease SbcCD nuclease subunit